MKNFLTTAALRFVARNVQSLLDFITRLDAQLDAYIAQRAAEIASINQQIEALENQRSSVASDQQTARRLQAGVGSLVR